MEGFSVCETHHREAPHLPVRPTKPRRGRKLPYFFPLCFWLRYVKEDRNRRGRFRTRDRSAVQAASAVAHTKLDKSGLPRLPPGLRVLPFSVWPMMSSLLFVCSFVAEVHWTSSPSSSSLPFSRRVARAGNCWRWIVKTARTGQTTAEESFRSEFFFTVFFFFWLFLSSPTGA